MVRKLLHCSPMATLVPQRELRNHTADLLRRVQAGEHLTITVHGHPVAELSPVVSTAVFIDRDQLIQDFDGLLGRGDRLGHELRKTRETDLVKDPFG